MIRFPHKVDKILHRLICPTYSRLTPLQTQSDGMLGYECVYQECDNSENISKFHSVDFSLSNLISIGSFGGLSYVSMSLNSDMNFVDDFANTFVENVSTSN